MALKKVAEKIIFIFISLLAFFSINSSALAATTSIPIELTVPNTNLQVEGLAVPNSLVVVKEANSTIASVIADFNGSFSAIISIEAGIHTISTSYTDTKGVKSQNNTTIVSVQPQTTQIVDLFLSPTFSKSSVGPTVIGSVIQFRGYTAANSLVTLKINYNILEFNTFSDSNGFYEFLIDSSEIGLGNHTAYIVASKDASLSDISKIIKLQIQSDTSPSAPDIIVRPSQLPPPSTVSPNDGAVINGNTVEIKGQSVPNAQINVYENDQVIGSIFADEYGNWLYFYSAQSSPATLTFEACINGKCSVLSKSLTLEFTDYNDLCKTEFELEFYRFWNISISESIELKTKNVIEKGTYEIDWGNGTFEKFDTNGSNGTLINSYNTAGNFNGTITFMPQSSDKCQIKRYFSVLVNYTENESAYSSDILWLLILIIGLLGLNYLVRREKQSTIQDKQNKL